MPALLALALGALLAGGCGGNADPPAASGSAGATATAATAKAAKKAATRPALCTRLRARITGRVESAAATELSGLVQSRTQPGVMWTHNDSGDRARMFAVRSDGSVLADVAVTGAEAVDWEDIAATHDSILLADIGDNLAQRPTISVYRVAEPQLSGGAAPVATGPATRLQLRYPDGAHDAEALLVDPSTGALVIVTKSFGGRSGVYVAARPDPDSITTLRRRGRLSLGVGEAVTAGDVSADGRTVALRTYDRLFVWTRRRGESVAAVLLGRPCTARADLLLEGQGEALALSRDGSSFYTVPEGRSPAIRRYAPG